MTNTTTWIAILIYYPTGNEKLRFTVAFNGLHLTACIQRTSDGYKAVRLSPLLIFKNLKKSPISSWHDCSQIERRDHANRDYAGVIYPKVGPGGYFMSVSLFPMDSTTCHTDPAITEAFKVANTDTNYIQVGMTPHLQFLDTHLNKPFKDNLKDRWRWEEWLDNGNRGYTRNGNRKRVLYEMVANWISDAWKEVARFGN